MNTRQKAAGVGFFLVFLMALGIAMLVLLRNSSSFGQEYKRYELIYDSSVKGLNVGASVTLRGVQIGQVKSIRTRFYKNVEAPLNSVVIDLYPERVDIEKGVEDDLRKILMDRGIGAKLKMQSLLTGLLYIEIDHYSRPRTIQVTTDYPQLPTVVSELDKIDFEQFDVMGMAQDVQDALANIRELTGKPEFQALPVNFQSAMGKMEIAMGKMGNNADAAGASMTRTMASMEKTMVRMNDMPQKR